MNATIADRLLAELEQAAGRQPDFRPPPQSRRPRQPRFSDETLLCELHRTVELLQRFPKVREFNDLSERSWSTLRQRFGRKPAVVARYETWIAQPRPIDAPLSRSATPRAAPTDWRPPMSVPRVQPVGPRLNFDAARRTGPAVTPSDEPPPDRFRGAYLGLIVVCFLLGRLLRPWLMPEDVSADFPSLPPPACLAAPADLLTQSGLTPAPDAVDRNRAAIPGKYASPNAWRLPSPMSVRIANLRLPVEAPESDLPGIVAPRLGVSPGDLSRWRILKKSLDARSPRNLQFVYTVLVDLPEAAVASPHVQRRLHGDVQSYVPPPFDDPEPGRVPLEQRPVVVGSGPAGLLAGYYLALKGYRPLILERGRPVKERVPAVRAFDRGGPHDPEDNYLFGEGGAGCFSDGKLTCRLEGPDIDWVLERFVDCGGRPSIVYENRPHLGSNKLPMLCRNFRRKIEALGGEYRFGCRLEGLQIRDGRIVGVHTSGGDISTTQVVLAIGHSARDTYEMLHAAGVPMGPKAFQLGLRIEQPQVQIDRQKYGKDTYRALLGAADYSIQAQSTRDVFSFCMCAGGIIIPSVSEPERFCTNGMSNSRHDTPFANSGVMATLQPHEFGGDHPLAGMELQRRYEAVAFELAGRNYRTPIQTARDFLAGRTPDPAAKYDCSYQRGSQPLALDALLPPQIIAALRQALPLLDRKLRGSFLPQAILVGPEMRGSAPVRMERDPLTRQTPGMEGLYPVGEGAGYAGGIVSAAVDGLRSAREIVRHFAPL